MIDLLEAYAIRRGWRVAYTSGINLGEGRQEDKLGGWDGKRQEIQVFSSLTRREKVFVLAHELVHAELDFEQTEEGIIKNVEDLEVVVHCAADRCLEELGVSGYREFCLERGRVYQPLEDLREAAPDLANLAEGLGEGMAFEVNEALEASL